MEERTRPWNEEEWEAELRRSDLRAAKFGELLETLSDDPNCEQVIAREMGWTHMLESGSEEEGDEEEFDPRLDFPDDGSVECGMCADDDDDEFDGGPFDPNAIVESATEDLDIEAEIAGRRERLREVVAYRLAHDTGLLIHDLLRPYMAEIDDEHEDEASERLVNAYSHALRPAPKIAGGHGMGYEDEAICGNIVCNRIALDSVKTTEAELAWLRDHEHVPADIVERCLVRLAEVRAALDARIAELRARVWW